ncbi:MAG TPA: saccharopine dehydrogenase NADP-binding domain-containing protein [Hydrogenophaga sp.]|uniref:saccharopine dehydrogenase NADP-binding domain-containing protein n=1 Tax=Hydrogenophaga sp. TaxID=1904254 RepID=UPI002B9DB490|nr:saccharopine dehydrogenase NADP-binding domain-containing protein [Hydrogenophaga sp.]HMN92424.1 saccharopine dehydrogenase NADP-binding domain-containing protein [Hydrogenophaga sp.]HMP10196.1 saccharopine dehydrogenase NADP-binding domain-containing protein [Hydrogenophaga sp.]
MKRVTAVSLGSSRQDFEFETDFLGHHFQVRRMGADDDISRAWELMRRQQNEADAIGLGEVGDHYHVGQDTRINKETQRLLNVVTRVPATTGSKLRRLLQVRAVRQVHHRLGEYFKNNLVLFLSGMRNYDMAVAMSDYTPNLKFADALAQTGAPAMLTSLQQLELYAKGSDLALSGRPGEILEAALSGFKQSRIGAEVARSHVIVGTFHELKEVGNPKNLTGKTVITSAVDEDRLAFFKRCHVNLVVDVSPQLFERVVGSNVIEAMILAALGKPTEAVSDDDFTEIIDELDIQPRLLHPTGHFRNIRRFAFVIHPLSQEFIKKGIPIPKATPKFVMDKVETLAAHMPPMVYCKMENIVSPTGAEAEGWLITVGGTPREMLARSPEFTYRRLLAAADMAEKLGAQIMGLGAFTKVVGDAGVTVARRARIPITTGNSYSASGALWAAADAMKRMGLVKLHPQTKKVMAKTMVIGATGSIGSVSARLLAMAFQQVVIAGRDLAKLEQLKASILKDAPDADVVCSDNYDELLGEMDMIVTSTSGAGKKILDIMKVKPGCVITDVARPLDLPPEEVAKRPDVLVIESGEIELPTQVKGLKSIGLPPNVIYACLAETIVLALEGRFEVFTIGRDTEWPKVKEIYRLGLKHGMKLAAISGAKGVYSDEDIARVVALARKARRQRKAPTAIGMEPTGTPTRSRKATAAQRSAARVAAETPPPARPRTASARARSKPEQPAAAPARKRASRSTKKAGATA